MLPDIYRERSPMKAFDDIFNLDKFFSWDDFFSDHIEKDICTAQETEKTYELKFSILGVDKDNITIYNKGNWLVVSAENTRNGKLSYKRVFNDVDFSGAKATYKNGLLNVSLPKVESARYKKIEITE